MAKSRKKCARNLKEFLEWTGWVRGKECFNFRKSDEWGPWYRGQEDYEMMLRPALLRCDRYGCGTDLLRREDEILEEFCVRAPALTKLVPPRNDVWTWWFLMRHFGVPTRLLDWTESALLALYFAVKTRPVRSDAAVWALDPYRLNSGALGRVPGCKLNWVVSPCWSGVSQAELDAVWPWLPRKFKETDTRRMLEEDSSARPNGVVAINPTHSAQRIGAQQSCFTIHGSEPEYLDRFLITKDGMKCLVKIRIPKNNIEDITRELGACGIDEARAFPDLDGLGKALALKWRRKGVPE